MGEDIWSLVSRQLHATSSANTRHQQAGEVKNDGETEASGEGGDPADSADKVTAVCAFASFALCVGMPGAGKSTLLNTYLNPNNDSIPKPTVALEYMFARRASAANMPKVCHGDIHGRIAGCCIGVLGPCSRCRIKTPRNSVVRLSERLPHPSKHMHAKA